MHLPGTRIYGRYVFMYISTVFLKKFLTCRTLCLGPIDLVSDIVLYLSDIGSI